MYKKIIFYCICLTLLFALYNTGYSQDQPMKFGIRGGVNLANINQDFETIPLDVEDIPLQVSFDKSNYTTFDFGGFFEYWFSNTIGIQVNGLYNMKGVKAKGGFNASFDTLGFIADIQGDIEGTVKLTYISFPVLAKIAFGEGNALRPYLVVGPELGFLSSAKVALEMDAKIEIEAIGYSGTESFDEDEDIKDQLESTEFALNIGGGVEFPLGSAKGFLDARYDLGLTKINKATGEEVEDIFGDKDVKNNVIYVNVGIIF